MNIEFHEQNKKDKALLSISGCWAAGFLFGARASLKFGLNVTIAIFVSIGLFAVSLPSLMRGGAWSETIRGMLYAQLLQTALSWVVGIMFLYIGKRRLSRIE